MPSVMNKNHKPSYSKIPAPPPDKKREEEEFDISAELSGFGLQGVKMTNDELQQLAQDLGLDEEAAADLAKGLGSLDLGDSDKEVGDAKGTDISREPEEPTKEGKNTTENQTIKEGTEVKEVAEEGTKTANLPDANNVEEKPTPSE